MVKVYDMTLEARLEKLKHDSVIYCRNIINHKATQRGRPSESANKIALEVVKILLNERKGQVKVEEKKEMGLEELMMGGKGK